MPTKKPANVEPLERKVNKACPDCVECTSCELTIFCVNHASSKDMGVHCMRCGRMMHNACNLAELRNDDQKTPRDFWACASCKSQLDETEQWGKHKPVVSQRVERLYRVLKRNDCLAGAGADGIGLFGELNATSMQRILDFLRHFTGLNSTSAFLDMGSGCGKPVFHAAFDQQGVGVACGIEIAKHPWKLSLFNLGNVLHDAVLAKERPPIGFLYGNGAELTSLEPFTHIYGFDKGWSPEDRQKIATLFNQSSTATTLISFFTPKKVILEHGFDVRYVGKISTLGMAGSGQSHNAHVYIKASLMDANSQQQLVGVATAAHHQQHNNKSILDTPSQAPAIAELVHQDSQRIRKKRRGAASSAHSKSSSSPVLGALPLDATIKELIDSMADGVWDKYRDGIHQQNAAVLDEKRLTRSARIRIANAVS